MTDPSHEVYALCGTLAGLGMAVLHALVWRAQRLRWSAMFAASFAVMGLVFAFDAQLQPVGNLPNRWAAWMACLVVTLSTLGMIDYIGLKGRRAVLGRAAVIAVAVLLLGLSFFNRLDRLTGFTVLSGYLLVQAAMAAMAMWREPRRGHGIVLASLSAYPLAIGAVWAGLFDVSTLRYITIIPISMMGATVLTTGLLRAQQDARDELARRERAEEALRSLNDALEHRVTERTRELHDMVSALESFNRTVSHDLRGPLGGIVGVSRMASEAVRQGDTASAHRLLEAVTRQAESSVDLVGSLLALAKVGETVLAPQPIALEAFVRDTLDQAALADPLLSRLPVRVGPLPTVRADPTLLRQVFVNLVGNAAKFSASSSHPQIEVGAFPESGGHVLFVRDNGVGFPGDSAPGLFEPFHRLHGRQFQGHGVGLSIVRRIVERHGGRIWANSEPGAGATFYFTLGGSSRDGAP